MVPKDNDYIQYMTMNRLKQLPALISFMRQNEETSTFVVTNLKFLPRLYIGGGCKLSCTCQIQYLVL